MTAVRVVAVPGGVFVVAIVAAAPAGASLAGVLAAVAATVHFLWVAAIGIFAAVHPRLVYVVVPVNEQTMLAELVGRGS
jgi:hypothetical protein